MTHTTHSDSLEDRELEAVAMNIVYHLSDVLYEALPKDIAHEHFVTARQATNDDAIDFAKERIDNYTTTKVNEAVENYKNIFKLSDTYTFEDGTQYRKVDQLNTKSEMEEK